MLGGNQDLFQMRFLKRAIQREQKQNFSVPVRFSWRWCPQNETIEVLLIYRDFYVKKKQRSTTL
jgi:hypothetical protein